MRLTVLLALFALLVVGVVADVKYCGTTKNLVVTRGECTRVHGEAVETIAPQREDLNDDGQKVCCKVPKCHHGRASATDCINRGGTIVPGHFGDSSFGFLYSSDVCCSYAHLKPCEDRRTRAEADSLTSCQRMGGKHAKGRWRMKKWDRMCCEIPWCETLGANTKDEYPSHCAAKGGKAKAGWWEHCNSFSGCSGCCVISDTPCDDGKTRAETSYNKCRDTFGKALPKGTYSMKDSSNICCQVPRCKHIKDTVEVGADYICTEKGGKLIPGWFEHCNSWSGCGQCCKLVEEECDDGKTRVETGSIACANSYGKAIAEGTYRMKDHKKTCCLVPRCEQIKGTVEAGADYICKEKGGKVIPGWFKHCDSWSGCGLCCKLVDEECEDGKTRIETDPISCRNALGKVWVEGKFRMKNHKKSCCQVPMCAKQPNTEEVGAQYICTQRGGKVIPGWFPHCGSWSGCGNCCQFDPAKSCKKSKHHLEISYGACISSKGVVEPEGRFVLTSTRKVCCKVRECPLGEDYVDKESITCSNHNGEIVPAFLPQYETFFNTGACCKKGPRCTGSRYGIPMDLIRCSNVGGWPVKRWVDDNDHECCWVPKCESIPNAKVEPRGACKGENAERVSGDVPDPSTSVCCLRSNKKQCDRQRGYREMPAADCARFLGTTVTTFAVRHPARVCCRVPTCGSKGTPKGSFVTTLRKCRARGYDQVKGWADNSPPVTHPLITVYKHLLKLTGHIVGRIIAAYDRAKARDLQEGLICCGWDLKKSPRRQCEEVPGHVETDIAGCKNAKGFKEPKEGFGTADPDGTCCRVPRCGEIKGAEEEEFIKCSQRGGVVVPGFTKSGKSCCLLKHKGSLGKCTDSPDHTVTEHIACSMSGGELEPTGLYYLDEPDAGLACCRVKECAKIPHAQWVGSAFACNDLGGLPVAGWDPRIETFFGSKGMCCVVNPAQKTE